jgi:pheromone shutdown protein TraB
MDMLQDSDVLTEALKEFAEEFPQLMRPLIEERDEYMVFLLRTLATRCATLACSGWVPCEHGALAVMALPHLPTCSRCGTPHEAQRQEGAS